MPKHSALQGGRRRAGAGGADPADHERDQRDDRQALALRARVGMGL